MRLRTKTLPLQRIGLVKKAHNVGTGLQAQQSMIHAFAKRGFENPAHKVTKKGWREQFVKGLIRDDMAFRLGEGDGMKDLFTYLLPKGFTVPSHQTVRRDLDLLYTQLDNKVTARIHVSHVA
jgi:hypothetical protein